MKRVLGITRGLIFSQRLMLSLVEAGLEREQAYSLVQSSSMDVWADTNKDLKSECLAKEEIAGRLGREKIEEIFDIQYFLRNIDVIYSRIGL
jgi:adenylosuccinate lyase